MEQKTKVDNDSGYQGPDMVLQFLSGRQTVSTEQALAFYLEEKSNYGLPQIHKFVQYFDLQKLGFQV